MENFEKIKDKGYHNGKFAEKIWSLKRKGSVYGISTGSTMTGRKTTSNKSIKKKKYEKATAE